MTKKSGVKDFMVLIIVSFSSIVISGPGNPKRYWEFVLSSTATKLSRVQELVSMGRIAIESLLRMSFSSSP